MTDQIVEDKGSSIEKADLIAMKVMALVSDEIRDHLCSDDPAENSYLAAHIMGNLYARMCLSLEGYQNIYGIDGMNAAAVQSWIHIIASEYLHANLKDKQ